MPLTRRHLLFGAATAPVFGAPGYEAKLAVQVLIVHGEDGEYHALENKCTHAGRRLDPLPGRPEVECCSIGKMLRTLLRRRSPGSQSISTAGILRNRSSPG